LRAIPGEGTINDNTAAIVESYGMCNNGPTLHLWGQPEQEKDKDRDQDEDQAVDKELSLAQYQNHYTRFIHRWNPENLQLDTLETNPNRLFTEVISEADFVFWGYHLGSFDISLFNHKGGEVVMNHEYHRNHWNFIPIASVGLQQVVTRVLHGRYNYIVFMADRFGEYKHIILDYL
jgi:hypothetical protein